MKPVLIIENSSKGLKLNESASSIKDKKYVMEGVFTEFDIKNRNERIYTAQKYLPFLNEMLERRSYSVIWGEYDHPDVFDVSMKNVSHIVENAWYNEKLNRVDGEIRLLSTSYGRDAKAIVNDGCPLFVSSRAAGVTESNNYVTLKKLFTYDLVADPGFPAAKMHIKSLNESLGYSNETNYKIIEASKFKLSQLNEMYSKDANQHIFDLTDETKTNQLFEMNKNDFVTKKQLTDYSNHLTSEIKKIRTEITSKIQNSKGSSELKNGLHESVEYMDALQAQFSKMEEYLDYLSEKIQITVDKNTVLESKTNKIVKYNNYLGEKLDQCIVYGNYISEQLGKNIDYSDYLGEKLGKNIDYSQYIAEKVDSTITYGEYLAEQLDANVGYSEMIAENLGNNIAYSEMIAENVNHNISYGEYLAEEMNSQIKYTNYIAEQLDTNVAYSEMLGENLDSNIKYSEYVCEVTDQTMSYANMITSKLNNGNRSINEKIVTAEEFILKENGVDNKLKPVNENKKYTSDIEKPIDVKTESISNKIDKLITEAKKREASKVQKPAFFAFLNPNDIQAFESMSYDEQEKSIVAINESTGYYSRHDVLTLVKKATEKERMSTESIVLSAIPKAIQTKWETINEGEKKSILAQSKFYDLRTPELINHFWTTRKFSVDESKKIVIEFNNPLTVNKLNESEIDNFLEKFKRLS